MYTVYQNAKDFSQINLNYSNYWGEQHGRIKTVRHYQSSCDRWQILYSESLSVKPSDITKAVATVGKSFTPKAFLFLMEKFEYKIGLLQDESVALKVSDADSEAKSVELAITVKSLNSVIDKARMSAKRPYLDFGKELDGYVRPSQKSLDIIEKAERRKCMDYRNRLLDAKNAADALAAKKLREEEAAAAKAKKSAAPKANEVTETEHALSRLNAPTGVGTPAPAKTVESYAGGSGSYDIVKVPYLKDITKVPAQYLLVDWKKVKADIRDGVFIIPGIDIKEENKLTLRRS